MLKLKRLACASFDESGSMGPTEQWSWKLVPHLLHNCFSTSHLSRGKTRGRREQKIKCTNWLSHLSLLWNGDLWIRQTQNKVGNKGTLCQEAFKIRLYGQIYMVLQICQVVVLVLLLILLPLDIRQTSYIEESMTKQYIAILSCYSIHIMNNCFIFCELYWIDQLSWTQANRSW